MKYPLLGTHFVLDEEKILRDGKYDLGKMFDDIEKMATESGLIKIDKNTYHCKGDKYDLGNLGIFIYGNLMRQEWFTLNVKKWLWLSEEEGDEDLIGDKMGVCAS